MQAYAPNGAEIVGTLENVSGSCGVDFTRKADGTIGWDHDGTGTKVFWDGQITVERDGKTIFLDSHGEEWTIDQLRFEEPELAHVGA